MKAIDLMIGDWVQLTDPINDKEMTKVEEIHHDGYITVDGAITKMFEPIPLTPEILLKNGFKQRKQGGVVQYILTADYYDVYVTEYPDGWWLVEYEDSERGGLPTERIAVRNIHQLQSAFKLFGIEKEIEI